MDSDGREAKKAYGVLYAEVTAILNRYDPLGLITLGAPDDEYEPQVDSILPRLEEMPDAASVQEVIREEFVRGFGDVGMFTYEQFEPVALEVWTAWLGFRDAESWRRNR